MACGHKFSGQMRNYSSFKLFTTAKMIGFGLNPKIQCLLNVKLELDLNIALEHQTRIQRFNVFSGGKNQLRAVWAGVTFTSLETL